GLRLLLFLREFADDAGAVRALRTIQRPQFRQRLRVHGGDRRGAVRHYGADHAVHAIRARLSDPDRRLPARLARRRHAAAFLTLPGNLRNSGTSILTLVRNIGSSIGISMVIANLTDKTIEMHARIV